MGLSEGFNQTKGTLWSIHSICWIQVVSVPLSAVLSNKVVVIVILSSSTQRSSGRGAKSMIFPNPRHECWRAKKAHWPFDLLCVLNKHQMVDIQHIHYLRAWSVVPAANSHRVPLQACNWTACMQATLPWISNTPFRPKRAFFKPKSTGNIFS